MKTILLATDFSKMADNALAYAAALAQDMHARLVLFHALNLATPTSAHAPVLVSNLSDIVRENNERLRLLANEVHARHGIAVDYNATTDLFMDGLEKQARKHSADLLVMGIRGETLVHQFFGSVTTMAIKESVYPLLVIPEEAKYKGIGKILFACDYHCLPKNSQLEPLQMIASALRAEVQILHVEKDSELGARAEEDEKIERPNMEAILRGIKHSYAYIRDRDTLEGIERGIAEYHADIAVMVPHSQGFLDSLLHPSKTRKLALHTHIPLLILPEAKRARLQPDQPDKESIRL